MCRTTQDFQYLVLEAMDNMREDMLRHLDRCHEFIDEGRNAGGGVLIHCQAGISRSATVVRGLPPPHASCASELTHRTHRTRRAAHAQLVAYLMRTLRLPLAQALEMARKSRPQLCPNDNFLAQLRTYEAQLALAPSPTHAATAASAILLATGGSTTFPPSSLPPTTSTSSSSPPPPSSSSSSSTFGVSSSSSADLVGGGGRDDSSSPV